MILTWELLVGFDGFWGKLNQDDATKRVEHAEPSNQTFNDKTSKILIVFTSNGNSKNSNNSSNS